MIYTSDGDSADSLHFKGEESRVNLVHVPVHLVGKEIIKGDITVIGDTGGDSARLKGGNPSISTGIDRSPAPNFPENNMRKNILAPHQGSPYEGGVATNGPIHNINVFEVPGFKDAADERFQFSQNSPNLFG